MTKTITLLAATMLVVASFGASAFAENASSTTTTSNSKTMTVRTGYLTCHVAAGWGFIFGSSRDIKCAYALQPGYTEYYTGSISKFGADIGYLQSAVLLWSVAAPTNNLGQGALAGHYAGATASLALGVGAGANVLVGGFKNSIALQPVSVEGQNGLNVAAGVAELTLKFDRAKKAKSD
ncbi:MAG: DUF992 domain-containing protein [Candidatus Binataceae bacterium]